MSGSAIADALVTIFGSASVVGVAAKDNYDILSTAACAAAVVNGKQVTIEADAFGDTHLLWRIAVDGFVRDVGDPTLTMRRCWLYVDKVATALRGDPTLQGTAFDTTKFDITWDVKKALDAGGATFIPIDTIIHCMEVD